MVSSLAAITRVWASRAVLFRLIAKTLAAITSIIAKSNVSKYSIETCALESIKITIKYAFILRSQSDRRILHLRNHQLFLAGSNKIPVMIHNMPFGLRNRLWIRQSPSISQ
jgi:hypothetical protein